MEPKSALFYLPYLPPVEWCRQWVKHNECRLERHENFVKSTNRNRCEITGANGRQTLSIPILGGRDHHQLYKDVRIAYTTDWQRQHWQSIRSAYGSAPFYEHYADRFQIFYEKRYDFLFDFNLQVLQAIFSSLRLNTENIEALLTTAYEKTPIGINDFRNASLTAKPIENSHTYPQVFADRYGFQANLSVLDLLFNEGPVASKWLKVLS